MTRWTWIIAVAWVLPALAFTQQCTRIMEEGSSGSATFYINPTNYVLLDWKMTINGDEVDISRCDALARTCVDEYPDEYHASVFVHRDNSTGSEYYESSLKIDQAIIAMSEIELRNGPYVIGTCPLQVFVRPEKPTCDAPQFINSNEQIKVTCRTNKVYPKAECDFYHTGPGNHIPISLSFIQEQSDFTSLYSTECTCTIDTKELTYGEKYQFYVEVYPDVVDGKNFSVFSDNTTVISYEPPTVTSFSANGELKSLVIDEGSDVTFVCEATSEPNATLTLYQKSYKLFDLAESRDSNTLVHTEPNFHCTDSDVFMCQASNGDISTRSVEVYVKCALALEKESDNNSVFSPDEEGDVVVNVDVVGYPSPRNYVLQSSENSTKKTVDRGRFYVRYIKSASSLSLYTISLTLLEVEPEQATSYLLTVDNGVGAEKLNIGFSVSLDNSPYLGKTTAPAEFPWLPVVLSVAGGIVLALLFGLFAYLWYRRKINRPQQSTTEETNGPDVALDYISSAPNIRDSPPTYHSVPYEETCEETCV